MAEKEEVTTYYSYTGKQGHRAFKHIRDNKLLIDTVVQVCLNPGDRKTGRARCTGITFVALGYLKNYINNKETKQINRQQFELYFDTMITRLRKITMQ